jgi:3-isopropylmalate dehydrogenase
MALQHTLGTEADARLLDNAVADALTRVRTPDVAESGKQTVSTAAMGDAVLASLDRLSGA